MPSQVQCAKDAREVPKRPARLERAYGLQGTFRSTTMYVVTSYLLCVPRNCMGLGSEFVTAKSRSRDLKLREPKCQQVPRAVSSLFSACAGPGRILAHLPDVNEM